MNLCNLRDLRVGRRWFCSNRLLKNSLLLRLLKKVQIQGAAPIFDGYPPRREAYLTRTSQRRGSAATP